MFWRIALLTVAVLVGGLALAFFTAQPDQREAPSAAAVLDLFDRVAFSGFGEGGPTGSGPYLRRWTGPVRVAVIGGPQVEDPAAARAWTDGVTALAGIYDQLPGLDVAVVDRRPWSPEALAAAQEAGATLIIVTLPEAAAETLALEGVLPPAVAGRLASARAGGCGVAGAEAAVLARVGLFLRDDLSESQRNTCLGETLATALGFTVQARAADAVFRLRQGQIALHPLGRMALSLVYDPALEPGQPRAAALEQARALLRARGLE